MKEKSKYKIFLTFLILLIFIINYSFLDSFLIDFLDRNEFGVVERVIDGDTIKINQTSVRLLGINTPERGEKYYSEAKDFLENKILNKTVILEFGKDKTDFYGRKLTYIYFNNKNMNLELIQNGLANPYFLKGKTKYYVQFFEAWKNCVEKNIKDSMCENSQNKCKKCVLVKEINVDKQEVIIENICSKKCNISQWNVKDEGRKKYYFPQESFINSKDKISLIIDKTQKKQDIQGKIYYWNRSDYVWTKTGDTLFLRDSKEKIVLWENY